MVGSINTVGQGQGKLKLQMTVHLPTNQATKQPVSQQQFQASKQQEQQQQQRQGIKSKIKRTKAWHTNLKRLKKLSQLSTSS